MDFPSSSGDNHWFQPDEFKFPLDFDDIWANAAPDFNTGLVSLPSNTAALPTTALASQGENARNPLRELPPPQHNASPAQQQSLFVPSDVMKQPPPPTPSQQWQAPELFSQMQIPAVSYPSPATYQPSYAPYYNPPNMTNPAYGPSMNVQTNPSFRTNELDFKYDPNFFNWTTPHNVVALPSAPASLPPVTSADFLPPSLDSKRVGDPPRASQTTHDNTWADSIVSKKIKYRAEKPKRDEKKSWVRTNTSTAGNARTGKTNNFGNGEYLATTVHPIQNVHPVGKDSWTSPATGREFRYNQWGEFTGVAFDADTLSDYLFNHPFNQPGYKGPGKLIIWIQKLPGDSARRVETKHGLKCRVKECPCSIYDVRTINTGAYRVAFDEQWSVYGADRNPMHVAGYAHLYCIERFFDFAEICRRCDVRADDRELEREPTGAWVAGLKRETEEFNVAQNFVDFMKMGRCEYKEGRRDPAGHWRNYPVHAHYARGARKQHDKTLTFALTLAKEVMTGTSKMKMMQSRDRSATQFFVNKGDLQMQIDAQQAKVKARKSEALRKRRRNTIKEEDEDSEAEFRPRPKRRKRVISISSAATSASPTEPVVGRPTSAKQPQQYQQQLPSSFQYASQPGADPVLGYNSIDLD